MFLNILSLLQSKESFQATLTSAGYTHIEDTKRQTKADRLRSFLLHRDGNIIPPAWNCGSSATSDSTIRLLGQSAGEGFQRLCIFHRLSGRCYQRIEHWITVTHKLQEWLASGARIPIPNPIRIRIRIEIGVFALLKCSFKEIYNVCHLSTSRVLGSLAR